MTGLIFFFFESFFSILKIHWAESHIDLGEITKQKKCLPQLRTMQTYNVLLFDDNKIGLCSQQ